MSGIKKERWTEVQVVALPVGEHDYFDRKSGALLADPGFREKCAKAISAFANSDGGHLILGVSDDGTFDGLPPMRQSTRTREWLEQVIPSLVSFELEDFRVHEVEPASPSAIPSGKVLIVIDVGDSPLAPHQATPNATYYYRVGGHSKPAPHSTWRLSEIVSCGHRWRRSWLEWRQQTPTRVTVAFSSECNSRF